jgi:ABC-2 type transport system ATP-binding protein
MLAMTTLPMISLSGLRMRYGRHDALLGLDLQIARGELLALIGPDGAGKTTCFRIIAGLQKPTGGAVALAPIRTFGFVPQRFGLYEDLSIDENLALRARLYGVPRDVARDRASSLLRRVGLARFGARLAGALSGGMKQKLSLVSALMTEPELLLLDEPTTGVDPVSRREFWDVLNELHHAGMTILVSTPYMDEAEYASRIAFLDRGRLSALGTREEILATYLRPLIEVRSIDRVRVRGCLAALEDVDDLSLFGTRLHVRGREGTTPEALLASVRRALAGLVRVDAIAPIEPSLEDVFVLTSEANAAGEA